MNFYRRLVIAFVTISAISLAADTASDKYAENDLCKWAKDYHNHKKFKKGDEITEFYSVSANKIWVSYSGTDHCIIEFAKATRNCDKILVKNGDTRCILGDNIFMIPRKEVRGAANVK